MQNTWWLMNFQGTVVMLRSKFNMSSIWRFSFFFPATPPLPLQAVSLAPCLQFNFVVVLARQFFYMYLSQASVCSMSYPPVDFWPLHMSTGNQAGLVSGRWNSPWVHLRNFSLVSEMTKSQRSWGWVLAPNLPGHKASMMKHKNFQFCTYHTCSFGNS